MFEDLKYNQFQGFTLILLNIPINKYPNIILPDFWCLLKRFLQLRLKIVYILVAVEIVTKYHK